MCGCAGFWEDVSSRDFKVSMLWTKPPAPLDVLRDSTDGDKRAKAFRALGDPKQRPADGEVVERILIAGASGEKQALCRLAAISSLGKFKGERAATGLKDAYFKAEQYSAETATMIRCQTLLSLGENGDPSAIELLTKVVKEPPVEGSEQERQQALDVRIAAARALGRFHDYAATESLIRVMQTEKDVALRNRAHDSLVAVTGKQIPDNYQDWDGLLAASRQGGEGEKSGIGLTGWFTKGK
jgi:HEAT repeat protein